MSKREAAETIPVVHEQAAASKQSVDAGGVVVRKTVHEREALVDEPMLHDEVDIEHVAVNRTVDAPAPPREEGDVLIVPVYEEVVTVQRRWVLKEEIRLRRREVQTRHRERVALREEQVTIQRSSATPEESTDGEDRSRPDGQHR